MFFDVLTFHIQSIVQSQMNIHSVEKIVNYLLDLRTIFVKNLF